MRRPALLAALALALLAPRPASAAEGPPPAGAAPARPTPEARAAKARAWFTDTVLLDQQARPVRFYSDVLAGRVVCLSFVFTSCTEACPLIMQKLARVQASLGARAGEVQFVSLSVDPATDTPAALRAFAGKHRTDGPGFTYLTGARDDMKLVLGKLGQWVDDPGEHSTGLVAGNVRTNHWTRIRPDAPPQAVAEILRGLAEEDGPAAAAEPAAQHRN